MSTLQIIAIIFILYEVFRAAFPEECIEAVHALSTQVNSKIEARANSKTKTSKKDSVTLQIGLAILIIEVLYLIYVLWLLLTPFWYVGALLIVLSFVFKTRENPLVLIGDSALSILVLLLVLI